jgi:hypothetical protein
MEIEFDWTSIKTIRPTWTPEQCREMLDKIYDRFEQKGIETLWQVLEELVSNPDSIEGFLCS